MAEADSARQEGQQPGGPPRPPGPGLGQGYQPPGYQPPGYQARSADEYSPPTALTSAVARTAPTSAPEPHQPASTNPSSSANLMRTVIIILGAALLLLVVFDGIAALENKTTDDLNSLVSLIAGGFVGYLTPHVVNAAKSDDAGKGEGR
jgi:hypothetical protein